MDFSALIAARTRQFSGREWVFAAIDRWLADPQGDRVFLLAGEPGTGKTAIAARLAQASLGSVTLPNCKNLNAGFLAHFHFCQAGLDSTLAPMSFVQSLSESLTNHSPEFRAALEQQAASGKGAGQVTVRTGNVAPGATVIGANVYLEIHGDDAREMFDELARKPLVAHTRKHPNETVVILVDSLDEALTFNRERTITHLLQLVNDFPKQARFILTARSNNLRVFDLVGEPALDLITDAPPGIDEVAVYASGRLAHTARMPEPRRAILAREVALKSRGNFLYAYHVLNLLTAADATSADVVSLPDELDDVYRAFLKREVDANGASWRDLYRPVLGAIVVSRGDGLTKTQLSGITRRPLETIDDVLRASAEYVVGGDTADRPISLYHQSFREFLLRDGTYKVYPAERHKSIASFFLETHGKAWKKCNDSYALRHTPAHLAEAALGDANGRDELIRSLMELNSNERFLARCEENLQDIALLHDHFRRAVAAASLSESDDMLPVIARAGLAAISFRDRFLTGESVIALAKSGDTASAESRLALFPGLDRDWQTAAGLIIAWLAADAAPQRASELLDRLAPMAAPDPLPLLLDRARAHLNGVATVRVDEHHAESPETGRELVRRLSGQEFNQELLVSRGMNVISGLHHQAEFISAGGYSATFDGPVLVNSARAFGGPADTNVDAYIDAHAGYNYVEYRNRSLWVMLHAVLRHHPGQIWARNRLERILGAALKNGGAEFQELAPLTVTALLQARSSSAAAVVDQYASGIDTEISKLRNERGANDSWSLHRRRLTSLMEIRSLILRDPAGAAKVWDRIRELEASRVLEGFAGFRAPAELRLADALHVCGFPEADVAGRLFTALKTAHHIQDYHFCARITARCAALGRWRRTPLPAAALEAVVKRIVSAPDDGEFAAAHVIGESYPLRGNSGSYGETLPVWEATNATTLQRLADVFQRPAVEFLRLNPNIGLETELPLGTPVRVPDPGFLPLLAFHLATRITAEAALGIERVRLIRTLVPAASENATAFDSVFAYLVIASDPEDDALLADLVRVIGAPSLLKVSGPAALGGIPT